MDRDIVETFIEVESLSVDDFLKVKETLTRIGIPKRMGEDELPILWQTAHILHKKNRYYIVHFKQLFLLDGKDSRTDFNEDDQERVNIIARMLDDWKLVKLKTKVEKVFDKRVHVVSFKEKNDWDFRSKYSIGKRLDD